MTCCDHPDPAMFRVERDDDGWWVASTCRTCACDRRETPWFFREDDARDELERARTHYARRPVR